jgi:hypothetical protein
MMILIREILIILLILVPLSLTLRSFRLLNYITNTITNTSTNTNTITNIITNS